MSAPATPNAASANVLKTGGNGLHGCASRCLSIPLYPSRRFALTLKCCIQVKRTASNPVHVARNGYSLCAVSGNEELLQPATKSRSTRFVELDTSSDPTLT